MELLVTGLGVVEACWRVLGDGWRMNSSPEVTSSGPQGREGSIGAWKGDVVSDGCWDCDSPPLHTAVLQPSWGATQALISRIQSISWGRQAPAAWWLSFSFLSCALYLLSLEHIDTHTRAHTSLAASYSCVPVSLLTHSPWLHLTHSEPATHYLKTLGTVACPLLRDNSNNNTMKRPKE